MIRAGLPREDGFATIYFTLILTIGLLLLAVAGMNAEVTTNASARDVRDRQAIAAAESGLDLAVHRINQLGIDARLLAGAPIAQQCVVSLDNQPLGVNTSAIVGGRCPEVRGELGNGAAYKYTVTAVPTIPPCLLLCNQPIRLDRRIVATGTVGCPGPRCVQRRLATEVTAGGTRSYVLNLLVQLLGGLELSVYDRQDLVECTSTPPDAASPFSGC